MTRSLLVAALCLFALGAPAPAAPKGKKKKKPKVEKPEPTPEELKQIRWWVGQLGRGKHEFVRKNACAKLAEYGVKAEMAVNGLGNMLKERDPNMASAACHALGKVGRHSKAAKKALIKCLKDKRPELRRTAAEAFIPWGEDAVDAAPQLIKNLRDDDAEVRLFTVQALGAIGEAAKKKSGPALEKCIEDDDERVQTAAAVALARMAYQTEATIPLLLRALEDKRQLLSARREAALAIGRMGPKGVKAVPALIAIAKKPFEKNPAIPYAAQREKDHNSLRITAIETLGAIGPAAAEAEDTLTDLVGEEALAKAAEAALEKIRAK